MGESLNRFLQIQDNARPPYGTYEDALREIQQGGKVSHWMWFVFPILRGLGHSETARYFGLHGVEEAKAYIMHPVLGQRLVEISQALLRLEGLSAVEIFGSTDAWKLQCCMTLFQLVAPKLDVFHQVLEKYYDGKTERRTMRMLEKEIKI